ncbi:MAG: hypothetical protein Q8Q20_03525 [bacterium]|nr:hypothetical protein [bacterium]
MSGLAVSFPVRFTLNDQTRPWHHQIAVTVRSGGSSHTIIGVRLSGRHERNLRVLAPQRHSDHLPDGWKRSWPNPDFVHLAIPRNSIVGQPIDRTYST